MSNTEYISEAIIKLKPVGKGRPRAVRRGRHITLYTPAVTKEYEMAVRTEWMNQVSSMIEAEYFRVDMTFYFTVPKSYTAKQRQHIVDTGYLHNRKPDVDNVGKAVLDALNGIAYPDDAMICDLTVKKRYSDSNSIHIRIGNALLVEKP